VIEAAQQTRPDAVGTAAPALPQGTRRPSRIVELWRFRQLISMLPVE